MVFHDENEAVARLADLLLNAGANLFKASKYIYALSEDAFYRIDVKDVFKVVLNNICGADNLAAFDLAMDGSACAELNTPEYDDVFPLIVYSFAVRLPVLCVSASGRPMDDAQMRSVYYTIIEKGVTNIDDAVAESFTDTRNAMKKGKAAAPYGGEWFKAHLYSKMPSLADVTNRNLFFFGVMDVLFVLFYLCLEKEFAKTIDQLCAD